MTDEDKRQTLQDEDLDPDNYDDAYTPSIIARLV
jgi:hypothetical protein